MTYERELATVSEMDLWSFHQFLVKWTSDHLNHLNTETFTFCFWMLWSMLRFSMYSAHRKGKNQVLPQWTNSTSIASTEDDAHLICHILKKILHYMKKSHWSHKIISNWTKLNTFLPLLHKILNIAKWKLN